MPDSKPRIFTKKGPEGQTLNREVTGPSSEVEALFDGFREKPSSAKSSTTSSSGSGSSSSTS